MLRPFSAIVRRSVQHCSASRGVGDHSWGSRLPRAVHLQLALQHEGEKRSACQSNPSPRTPLAQAGHSPAGDGFMGEPSEWPVGHRLRSASEDTLQRPGRRSLRLCRGENELEYGSHWNPLWAPKNWVLCALPCRALHWQPSQ